MSGSTTDSVGFSVAKIEPGHLADSPAQLEEHLQIARLQLDSNGSLNASPLAQELFGLSRVQSLEHFLVGLEPSEMQSMIGRVEIDGASIALPDARGILCRARLWQYRSNLTAEWQITIQFDSQNEDESNPLQKRYFAQQQLLSIISHELRTPAATLRMLIDELTVDSDIQKHLPLLEQTSEHLMAVLQDMRQAINPEQNLPFTLKRFHPNRLLESVVSQMRRMAQSQGISIKMQLLADETACIETDVERCKIVLLNLIKNAICHSQGTEIIVKVELATEEAGKRRLKFSVIDNGIGISQIQLDRLTQPFERLHALEKGGGGTGLGLFVVKQTIAELNGSVEFINLNNKGLVVECNLICNIINGPAGSFIEAQQESQAFQDMLGRMRVLVVEDDPVIRMVSQRLLSKRVAQVDVAENGAIGLEKISTIDYDLILSDYFMPVMDGAEMIRKVREQGITTPILSVTAAVLGEEARELLDAGANKILAKPISMKAFIDALETLQP